MLCSHFGASRPLGRFHFNVSAMNTVLAFTHRQTKGRGTHLGGSRRGNVWGRLTSKEALGVSSRYLSGP